MPRVIKASERGAATPTVPFNARDVASQAELCLAQVRAEAEKIVRQAEDEADAIRRRAAEQGQRAASQDADRVLDARLAQQLETLCPALRLAGDEVRQARETWICHWEQHAVRLATAIARRVIRRELAAQPEIPLDLVREALQLAVGAIRVRVVMHPDDVAALGVHVQGILQELLPDVPAELVAAASIERGGCRVETDQGTIDQQFESQLARIQDELA